jgi:predicted dehydrogenase
VKSESLRSSLRELEGFSRATAMKKIRYGVVGIKGVGRLHIDSVEKNPAADLAALVDINEPLVRRVSQERRVRAFTDYRDMLEEGVVDAVSIATPHDLLAPIALDCLNAGVHVFVEKPFAIRISEADAVVRAAKARDLKLCVGYLQRTFRLSLAMKRLIESGAIGNLMHVLWTWHEFRPESYYTPDPWRGTFRDAGGGVLMSQVSHQLDLICWMLGKPVRVSAFMANQLHNAEIEDIVCANILFDSGTLGSLQFSINQARAHSVRQIAGDRGLILVEDLKSLGDDEDDEILLGTYGDRLSRIITQLPGDGDQPPLSWRRIRLSDPSALPELLPKSTARKIDSKLAATRRTLLQRVGFGSKYERPTGHSVLLDSFIDAILDGGEPIITGESARSTLELINALIISGLRNKTVDLPIDPDEYDCVANDLSNGTIGVPMLHHF